MDAKHTRHAGRILIALLLALLATALATPAFADGDDEGKVVFGDNVIVEDGEELEGDLVVFGGNVLIEEGGRVDGDVAVIRGDATVSGEVDGDLVALGGNVQLTETAIVDGDLVVLGGDLEREEGAVVRGEVIKGFKFGFKFRGISPPRPPAPPKPPSPPTPPFPFVIERGTNWAFRLFLSLLRTAITVLALTALGLLVVLFLPRQTQLVAQTALASALPSVGVGFLTVLVASVLVPLLVLICIGIPAAFLLVLVLVGAGLFGWIAMGLLVGERIMEALKAQESMPLVAVGIGVLVISLLSAVPCVGWLLALFVGLLGLGAVVLTRFGTTAYPATTPQPSVEEPAEEDHDDLTKINGIGPVFERRLNEAGIKTFAQLAQLTPEGVVELMGAGITVERVVAEDWVGQARALAGEV